MLQIKCDVCGEVYKPIPNLVNNLGVKKLCVYFGTSTVATEDIPHRTLYKEFDLCPKCAKMLFTLCGVDPSKLHIRSELEQFFAAMDEKEE